MKKIKLIAETAWHHDGDFVFMERLVANILEKSKLDILKMHITLDFDENGLFVVLKTFTFILISLLVLYLICKLNMVSRDFGKSSKKLTT